jgi:hypothetical protein
MIRAVSLTVAAGVLALSFAAGSAQAAGATPGILGKLTATQSQSLIEKAGWRDHGGGWHHRCMRRCMWRTDGAWRFCKRKCGRDW